MGFSFREMEAIVYFCNSIVTMEAQVFRFKQFDVIQDKAAMKVGTDGVLLGAWVELPELPFSVLDVGSGTGVIALMMAQRTNAEVIDAVELNAASYIQTVENFEASDWADRLFCYHASFQEFEDEIDERYDVIISNPPFYTDTFKEESSERTMARHTETLNYEDLLRGSAKLLSETGICAFVIPFKEEEAFLTLAKSQGLFASRICRVKGRKDSPIKRSLIQFSKRENALEFSKLVIEISRHVYTEDYIRLVKDFYLKM